MGIHRREFLKMTGLAAASAVTCDLAGAETGADHKPNIILIVADDLGYAETSCYPHHGAVRTPNIDRLAKTGVRMTDGYAADPMCWPSRASILTGKYHQRFRTVRPVPDGHRMIGHYLKRAGYATGCIGKWHNTQSIGAWDGEARNHPHHWGFDDFFGFLGGMHDYFEADVGTHWVAGRNRPYYMPVYDGVRPVRKVKYLTEELTDRAVDFIRRHARRPWPLLLYLAYTAIHSPDQAPEKHLQRRGGDARLAMIDALDEGLGRVLGALKRHGIAESTLVVFVGDNGGYRAMSNGRLRGGKGQLFEGGIRVPFVAAWPGRLPAGRAYEQPVMHIDLLPTILAAAGLTVPKDIDGVNLLPYWRGEKPGPPHEALLWGWGSRFAIRRGDWKLLNEAPSRRGKPVPALFHLTRDVEEKHNLIEQEAGIARELTQVHERWVAEMQKTRAARSTHAPRPGPS
jgi:arylsulfatase A-like enzyme